MKKDKSKPVHFEDIWNEAESLSDGEASFTLVRDTLEEMFIAEDKAELFGKLLFQIAHLSKEYNVNVAAALLHEINNKKIENYE
jgi:hypothetical protein